MRVLIKSLSVILSVVSISGCAYTFTIQKKIEVVEPEHRSAHNRQLLRNQYMKSKYGYYLSDLSTPVDCDPTSEQPATDC